MTSEAVHSFKIILQSPAIKGMVIQLFFSPKELARVHFYNSLGSERDITGRTTQSLCHALWSTDTRAAITINDVYALGIP